MELKPGSRWRSAVCDSEVVIVRPPKSAVNLECGGQAMLPHGSPKTDGLTVCADFSSGTNAGKRYADEDTGMEVLCTKAGAGSLSIDGRPLGEKEAKKLPASD
jgi:hypothetical protein